MKRIFDICIALAGLLVGSPILLVTALLVRVYLGSPVIFNQVRPGLETKSFAIYKFRTMTDELDETGELLPDAQRLTKFGRFLRASSLDELPELWNVLKGEMSFVGPRPLLTEYVPLYDAYQTRRHDVRPGITGWAQVKGRNALSWDEKFALDIWYVENHNLWLDIKILFMTVASVLRRDGIDSAEDVPMPKFTGNGTES